jgi:hypothetical protein
MAMALAELVSIRHCREFNAAKEEKDGRGIAAHRRPDNGEAAVAAAAAAAAAAVDQAADAILAVRKASSMEEHCWWCRAV